MNRAAIPCASARDPASRTQPAVCNPAVRQDALPIVAAFADFGGRSNMLGRGGFGHPARGALCHHANTLRRHRPWRLLNTSLGAAG